ncbi:MAG: peptidylprolyl isomerase [Clostridia bacterium]|nr:peptidylprolyl isomerase [Clostridia bacterium]
MKKIIALMLISLIVLSAFCACGKKTEDETYTDIVTAAPGETAKAGEHTRILFTMENGGTFTIELYPEYAPKTCENFEKLVRQGFYDGLTFHRVMAGFMAQGGDPNGNGTGGAPETIPGEFANNGFEQNTLSHTRGVVSMARNSFNMDSASSQFFICYTDNHTSSLDGNYAAFGKVIDGMETVDDFLKVQMLPNGNEVSKPATPIVIKSAVVVE